MNVMTTTNYYNNADPTSGSNARGDKILNLGNADPLAGDVPFPSSDPLVGASSFYPTSFAAAPQYNQDLPTAGPVESLFEGVGAFQTESVEANLDETPAMRLSVAQPQSVIGKNKHATKPVKKGRYSLEQKRILEQAFNADPNPSVTRISSLAQQTGLAELQIANWFSRQRKSGEVSKNSSESEEENSVSSNGNKSPRGDDEKPVRNAETILAPYIAETGGITRIEHMAKCHQIMQEEKNLEQRLFIVTVLSESSVNALRYFAFDLNGLAILDEWLQQYRKDNKVLLIKRILKVLAKTPVTVDVLTKVSIGKTVNSIVKKATDEVVRELGRSLVEKWKQLVQTSEQTSRPTTPEQSRKGTPSPPPTRAVPGGLRISNEGRPPVTAIRPTPVQSNGIEASDDFEAQLGTAEAQPKRKTSLGFDHLRRQKHGIQLKDDLQNEDDRLKRIGTKPTASKPISIDDLKRKKVQKQIMQEASLSNMGIIDATRSEPHSSPEPSSDEGDEPAAKRRKISNDREEVTQIRPSSPVLHDSDIEMMNESYSSRAQSHYNSHSAEEDEMGLDLEKVPDDSDTLPEVSLPSTPPLQTTPIIDEGSLTPRLMDSEDQETPPSRKRKRKGLSVRWAPDEQLTQIRLFDKEEASVHAQRDFKAAARAEHSNEKLSNDTIKKQEEDEWKERAQNMVPTIIWHTPIPIDFSKSVVKVASPESDEAKRLAQREQEQMMVSYWNDAQIPPNPKEAPVEDNVGPVSEPVVINPNVPITSDSLTQLLSSLQNKVGTAPVNRPVQQQMPVGQLPPQQQFNPGQMLFNNNTMPQQQPFAQQQPMLPQQGLQNLLLTLAGQGLLNPILAVAQQTQQMAVNPLLNLGAQPHNPNPVQQHQQSYSHHQGGRGGYHNNNNNQHYNNNNQYGQVQNYQSQGRGGYNDRGHGYNQNYQGQGRGGYNDRGRGGPRGGGQSRGGGPPRGHYRGGGRGGYNKN